MANVIIIGTGKIGSELKQQLLQYGHVIVAQAKSDLVRFDQRPGVHIHNRGDVDEILNALAPVMPESDAVMLAIPNGDKGTAEMQYMRAFRGKHIITCAKAAHAYRYGEVLALKQPIGRRASVGGGTDMLEILRRRQLQDEDVTIYAVVNGTLNFIWSAIQQGTPFSAAVSEAKDLGYAEPNNDDELAIVNGELLDVCMKGAMIKNIAFPCNFGFVSADDFSVVPLEEPYIRKFTSRNARYRFIVTFSTVPDHFDEVSVGMPGSIRATCGRWHIVGGFYDVKSESPLFDWLRQVDGVNNGFTVHRPFVKGSKHAKDSGNSNGGPGAGPQVTALAMVRDLHDLLAA